MIQSYNAYKGHYLIQNSDDAESMEKELQTALTRMCGYWAITSQLFSPSLGGMILGHTLPFTVLGIILVSTQSDASMGFLSEFPLVYVCNFAAFYIFQWRELRRFYEQAEANNQKDQLLTVLESISDSVVVIKPNDEVKIPETDKELHIVEPAQSDLPDILFCNSQSKKLFGTNLTGAIGEMDAA